MNNFPRSIVKGTAGDMNRGKTMGPLNEMFSGLYKEQDSKAGVLAIAAAGRFFVNGIPVPASEAEYNEKYVDGFFINDELWLKKTPAGWDIGGHGPFRRISPDFESAVCGMLAEKPYNGVEFLLYDDDNDGYADRITYTHWLSAQVQSIADNGDGTVTPDRGDFNRSVFYPERYARFADMRGDHSELPERKVEKERFSEDIRPGDVMCYYKGTDGWHYVRAAEARGVFNDGMDHEGYTVDGVHYDDAMMYPRNMLASNRPGGFANIMNYFGIRGDESIQVSIWLVPVSEYASVPGAPIGFTTNEFAKTVLGRAIDTARERLAETVPSDDGRNVPAGKKWVTPDIYDELLDAVKMAEDTMAAEDRGTFLDFMSYLLFVTLAGTRDDISAIFIGMNFKGFVPHASEYYTLKTLNGGDGRSLSDPAYDSLFANSYAAGDIMSIVRAGEVYINNYKADACSEFAVNGQTVVSKASGEWMWLRAGIPGCTDSFESAMFNYICTLSAKENNTTLLQAKTGSSSVSRICIRSVIPAKLAATGGNFAFLDCFDDSGETFKDAAGNPIMFRKIYADGINDNTKNINADVVYWKDADYRAGEWVLARA